MYLSGAETFMHESFFCANPDHLIISVINKVEQTKNVARGWE
jgi:hypothetical protein